MGEHPRIRFALNADLAAIGAIQRECGESATWNPQDYLGYDCRVVEQAAGIAGFLVTRRVAEGEYEILNLGIAHEFRRSGLASALVRDAVSASPGAWFLEVRESNQAARRLYEKLGFELTGRRAEYYSDPLEAAVVMRFFS